MSTNRLTFGGSACLTGFRRGVCSFDQRGQPADPSRYSHRPGCPSGTLYPSRGASDGRIFRAWRLHSRIPGAASAARLGQQAFVPGRCQWQHGAIPDGRVSPDRPAIGRNFCRGALFSTMDSPFSMQMASLNRRTALCCPQKLRNFRSQSRLSELQMI